MAAYTWPATLPQDPLVEGLADAFAIASISTPMDKGPAKTRRLGARQAPISMLFVMTSTQVATLETFVRDTLLGVRRFNFTHPRTGTAVEVALVPDGDGKLFSVQAIGRGLWHVSLAAVVMP